MARAAWLGVALLFFVSPAFAADEKKDDKPEPPKELKLLPAGSITGRLVKAGDDGKSLKIEVTNKVPTPVQDNYGRFRIELRDKREEIEIILADDCKIRIPPIPEFNDKTGKLKPFRPDPKDPDRKLGGVKGQASDLRYQQVIQITLGQTREKPPRFMGTLVIVVSDGPP